MFYLTWQEFSKRPQVAKLPLHEQVRQFQFEQQRHEMLLASLSGFGTGGGGRISTQTPEDTTINNYVANDYVENYFE